MSLTLMYASTAADPGNEPLRIDRTADFSSATSRSTWLPRQLEAHDHEDRRKAAFGG
jgi:hypothetical protein